MYKYLSEELRPWEPQGFVLVLVWLVLSLVVLVLLVLVSLTPKELKRRLFFSFNSHFIKVDTVTKKIHFQSGSRTNILHQTELKHTKTQQEARVTKTTFDWRCLNFLLWYRLQFRLWFWLLFRCRLRLGLQLGLWFGFRYWWRFRWRFFGFRLRDHRCYSFWDFLCNTKC